MIADEFGKKIGGSKRDQWKIRGLSIDDLADMNEKEKTAYVKKDNVWPKIDCEAMAADGKPVTIIYFIKKLRDSISRTPLSDNEFYINSISTMRSLAEGLSVESDIDIFFKKCEMQGFISRLYGRTYSMENCLKEIGGKKVFKAISLNLRGCENEIAKKKFMYSPEERILSEYKFVTIDNPKEQFVLPSHKDDPETADYCMRKIPSGYIAILNLPYKDSQKLLTGSVIAVKGYDYIASYKSEEEAVADILAKNAHLVGKSKTLSKPRKKKFLYKQLDNMTQSNASEIVVFSKTGEDYIDDFKFYGGEFGNWLSDADRQKNLDMAYVSFMNLAIALNVPADSISLGEKLSIAFGSRGRGNAMAHYEPLRKVINLTKWKGAGSLAHEYGHALDFILSEPFGLSDGFMSISMYQERQYPEIVAVLKAMKYNPDGQRTKFFENSQTFDATFSKDGGYWASTTEMFARAFACYINDKLAEKGIRDDYLCGHAETCILVLPGSVTKAYPEEEERKRINEAIEQMLATYLR